MRNYFALLLGVFFAVTALAPPRALADTTKKAKATKKKKEEAEAPIPVAPAQASTKALEEKLKKEDEEQGEPTRLAPAALPERGGELTRDDKADRRRDEAIEQIKKILPKMKNPHDVADLKFQLADLWWQKSRYVKFQQEMPAYQAEAEKWHKCRETKGDKACGSEPRPNHRKSELFRANAVDLYQRIIKEHPQYDRVDEIRFDLAYDKMDIASATENKAAKEKLQKEAIDAYKSLIAFNPKSDYVTDALIEMGNYYFDHNDLERASKAFGDAFSKHNKRTETYALYKLAWCRYNQGDYADSVKKLKEVVDRSEKQEKDSKIKLKSEALNDLILAFTKNGERDSAIKYYILKAGKEGSKKFIVKLANEFFTAGGAQYDDAIKTFLYLINDRPLDPYAPEWQSKIVLAYDKKSNRAKVREEIKVLVKKYGKGSAWDGSQKDKHVQDQARELTEEALYNLVTDYHQEAIKTKSVATYTLARDIYREYIDNFPDTERSYQMRFYYAEILYALEDYQEAFGQYKKVAEDNSQKQLKTTAAKDMLLAAEKLVDIDDGLYTKQVTSDSTVIDEGKKKDDIKEQHIHEKIEKDVKEIKLTPHEQQLVDSCDYYTKLVPDAEDEARVRLRAAIIYFDKHQYVAAADRFGYIIQKWPQDATSRAAAGLILEALESKQEWETLNKRAREFAQNKKLLEGEKKGAKGQPDFKAKLQIYIEGSTFKLAMQLQGKDDEKAAIEFATFFKEFPKSKYEPIAGYNAFLDYQKAKQLDKAIEIGEKIVAQPNIDSNEMRNLPGADSGTLRPVILPDLTFRLAKTYELTADFEHAAAEYEVYVKNFPAEKSAPDAQFNAALWYRGLGEDTKAIDAFTKYIKVYQAKKADERAELKLVSDAAVQWTICQIYESEKAWDKFVKCTEKDYLGNYHNVRGLKEPYWQVVNAKYHEFLAFGELDQRSKQNEMVKYIEDMYKVYLSADDKTKDTTKLAISHTQFFKLEPEFDHFKELKFRSAVAWRLANTMKEDLAAITAAQKALIPKYTEIVKYGNGDWAIAALVRIGMMPRIFANTLRNAPVPSNLDADQKEMYKGDLEDKALQIETPSVDLLLTAIKKSFELGIYNEWTLKAEAALAEFKPELVGPTRELPLKGSTFFFTADNEAPKDAPAKTAATQPADTKTTRAAGSGGDR